MNEIHFQLFDFNIKTFGQALIIIVYNVVTAAVIMGGQGCPHHQRAGHSKLHRQSVPEEAGCEEGPAPQGRAQS